MFVGSLSLEINCRRAYASCIEKDTIVSKYPLQKGMKNMHKINRKEKPNAARTKAGLIKTYLIQSPSQIRIPTHDRLNLRTHIPPQHDLTLFRQPA